MDLEDEIAPEVIASRWLGYPGATEEQIMNLETRLGRKLPPSYRAFLKASNGFRQPGIGTASRRVGINRRGAGQRQRSRIVA